VSVIRKTELNSVAAANHVCTILGIVAKLPFYNVLRAVLCIVNLIESEVRVVWVYGDFSPTLYIYIYIYIITFMEVGYTLVYQS